MDLLVAETMLGVTEPMAVLDAATGRIPVMCTLTVESDGSLFFGGNIYEAVETLEAMGACLLYTSPASGLIIIKWSLSTCKSGSARNRPLIN